MDKYLRQMIEVPFSSLYPDPNNPRLALAEVPGYEDEAALYDEGTRSEILDKIGSEAYSIDDLADAIVGQGWMPIDNILVWEHPAEANKFVVTEGNRRLVALSRLRSVDLEKARKKLARMTAKSASFSATDVANAEDRVRRLEQLVKDTDKLRVVPIDAKDAFELRDKLPRVLAVRHITGAREWGSYAEDVWLLKRFEQLFTDTHGAGKALFWDDAIMDRIANEASLTKTTTRRKIRGAKWYSHFRAEWEDELPAGESFASSDYYLFENIGKKPWVRGKLGVSESDLSIPEQGEKAIFNWIFREPRGTSASTNENIFYRHENVLLWDQMNRYDETNGTSFAARFDVDSPGEAQQTMAEVEAEWLMHKASKKPHAVLDDLLRRFSEFSAQQLAEEGTFLKGQLEQVRDTSEKFLKMIDAAGE